MSASNVLNTRLAVFGLILSATSWAQAASNELGWTLDSALKQIGRQGDDFKTVLADVSVTAHGADGSVTRETSGRIYINKDGAIRFNVSSPVERVILVTRNEVQDYDPTRALVERYSLSKHKNRLEPYARLGFTATGKDLKDNFLVTLLGEDRIGSERVLGLELTPKKEAVRQVVSKVALWISQASWMPVRQVIEHISTAETLTLDYTGTARNLNLNSELFSDRWPRGTERIRR